MIQPAGTKTFKGGRVSLPGSESYEKDNQILKDSGDFHAKGKATEKDSKDKAIAKAKAKIEAAKKQKLADVKKPGTPAGDDKK